MKLHVSFNERKDLSRSRAAAEAAPRQALGRTGAAAAAAACPSRPGAGGAHRLRVSQPPPPATDPRMSMRVVGMPTAMLPRLQVPVSHWHSGGPRYVLIVPASPSGLGLGGGLPRPSARERRPQSESEPGLPGSRSESRAGPPAAAAAAAAAVTDDRTHCAGAQALLADDRDLPDEWPQEDLEDIPGN